ncbi:hypothetical protein EPN87_03855 [archaeon]|nr:MAG: hypothetical protein EPN87_03855 [archaeon]
MAVIRTIGKAVCGALFAIFLGLALTTMGMINLTSHDTIKPLASGLVSNQLESAATSQQLSQVLDDAKQQCQGRNTISAPVQGINLTVKCSDIISATPQDVPNIVADSIVEQTINKTYSCEPVSCLMTLQGSDRAFYIFSSAFNDFLKMIVNVLWVATALSGAGYWFAMQGLPSRLKGFGITLIVVGIPYFITNFLLASMIPLMLPPQLSSIQPIISQMIGQMSNNFLYALIAGVALLVGGITLGLLTKRKKK